MKNGAEVLARLPYPSTKPNRLALASEVATLDLVRANCIPVPKVLYYSADAKNPVGAEFMIMEKVPGRPIGERWFDLSEKERLKIISEVVRIEAKLSEIHPPAYGSIYYERDLQAGTPRTAIAPTSNNQGFCVGPYVSLRWWYQERGSINIDRGPHSSPLHVLSSVAAKELAWLKAYGRPRLPFERAYRESMKYQKSQPEEHIESLEKYLRIAPYLVPRGARFHKPTIRHPDLQPNNVFVSENLDITGIIDWQHCTVLPQFLTAGIPKYFQNYHDEESLRFVPPKLPDNLAELNDEEHAEALERYRRRHLHFFYLGFSQRSNPAHFEALDRRADLLTRKVFEHAGEPWEGNSTPLKADLMQIAQLWPEIMNDNGFDGVAMPLSPEHYTEHDVHSTFNVLHEQEDTDTQLEHIRNAIGISVDGWTSNEEYEGCVERAKVLKKQAVDSLDTEEEKEMTLKHWPFDYFDEEDVTGACLPSRIDIIGVQVPDEMYALSDGYLSPGPTTWSTLYSTST